MNNNLFKIKYQLNQSLKTVLDREEHCIFTIGNYHAEETINK